MNENPFKDNDVADNYYEEEDNSDLESRLYANIHYASIENETSNEVLDISRTPSTNETSNINDAEIVNSNEQNVTSSHKYTENIDNVGQDSYKSAQQNEDMINNKVNKTVYINLTGETCNNYEDPYIFDVNVEDQSAILPIRSKKKRKRKREKKTSESHDGTRQELPNIVFKSPNSLPISPQLPSNSKNLSIDHSNSKNSPATSDISTNKKCSEKAKNKKDAENIFMKYQKSKHSLNKVYTEKHKEIERMNTKYDVLEKKEKDKLQDIEHSNSAKNVDSDSDSDQSILEIPVPPKPQPPIVNLNDSDEDIECINNDDIVTKQPLTIDNCNTVDFRNQVKRALSKSQSELTSVDNSETLDNANATEDIILNCTEIQKSASNINEIREMSKNVQRKKKSHATEQNNSDVLQESVNIDNNKTKSRKRNANKKHLDIQETNSIMHFTECVQTPLMNTNVDYTEDVFPADAFIRSQNELNANKKRQLEQQHQINDKVKRKKNNNEPCQSKTSTSNSHSKIQENTYKSVDNSFFRPMSEQLKAFYTDSRGQENFDINEVQSQMSKDPQLWAILGEDLRPNSKKQRFWNLRCTHCQQHGHQRHNCPEPRRPPKCYMCGIEGHTEVRCPQKMCLTCGKRQGTFRKTCETCRTFYCTMCSAVGHKCTECPDLWRRYHQTTTTDNVSIPGNKGAMKPANLLSCCNCTKRGHDSSMCKDYRWSQHFPTPSFVSNYIDGPTYMEEQTRNMDVLSDACVVQFHDSTNDGVSVKSSDDLLPFPKELLKKTQSRRKAFPQNIPQLAWESERNIAYIIYQCGDFYTLENDGMELKYTIIARKGFNTYNIMECHVVPNFLEKLLQLFRFEVKIYKEISSVNEIILRIRTFANVMNDLRRLILYWLSLEDDEKDYVIFLNLPMQRTAMLNILHSQIKKLGTVAGNASNMYNVILTLKFDLQNAKDQKDYDSMLSYLQETQCKLLLLLSDHPNLQKISEEIRNLVKILEKSTSEDVSIQQFLQILTVYNFLFVPHTPPKSFITKYGKKPKLVITAPRNTERCNANSTVPNIQTQVQRNSTIPVIITDRTSSRISSRTSKISDINPAHKDFSNMSNVGKQIDMPPPQAAASSNNIRFESNVDRNDISEDYRTLECNDSSGAATNQTDISDDFIRNRKIVQYDTISASHDFLPIDTASEKYTNITVNVSNKNKVHASNNLKSNINNSRNDESQSISKCTNITLNVSNKNHTDAANPKLNMDNPKSDKCQNTNKYTNITVSVSNKDQNHTTTSFQTNVNSPKNNKQQKNKKYTNITVSVSNKNQAHTTVSTVSKANKSNNYNLRSKNIDNSNKNQSAGDDDDVVCIEIKKKIPNHEEKQQKNQSHNSNKKILTSTPPKAQKGKKMRKAMKIRLKLILLYQTITRHLGICSSNNKDNWKEFIKKVMINVNECNIPYLQKAAKAWKTRIQKNILSSKDVDTFQQLVRNELHHRDEMKKLYDSLNQNPKRNNAQNKADKSA